MRCFRLTWAREAPGLAELEHLELMDKVSGRDLAQRHALRLWCTQRSAP